MARINQSVRADASSPSGLIATCRRCGQVKDSGAFAVCTDSVTEEVGLQTWCRECQRAQRQAKPGRPRGPRASVPAPVQAKAIERKTLGETTTAETDYIPNPEALATFVAAQMIVKAGGLADNFVYIGPSGSGKTEAARDLARRANLPFTKVDASAMTDPEAWFGTREVVVEDGAPKTVYNPSAFVTAVTQPGILLIDEGNRAPDAIRQILLPLWDDTRQVTNPLTGQVVERDPGCFIIMTGNVGLNFTGTYAVDPAFWTRASTTTFGYLDAKSEAALAVSRTGCDQEVADLFVRFANETRTRNQQNEDFPPVSTREVLKACRYVAAGLDANLAAYQVMINAAPSDGGAESVKATLEMIWGGVKPA